MLMKLHLFGSTNLLPPTSTTSTSTPLENFVPIPNKTSSPLTPNGRKHATDQDPPLIKKLNSDHKMGGSRQNKVHSTCSTKHSRYRGRIPAILQALNSIQDLDVALRPWQESLSSKEMSIVLKEQVSWERALQIFEWFKRKNGSSDCCCCCCSEPNAIHYNIMLRALGKAREWSLVESLWSEMNARGVSPLNSTYGTLIDVYSKGGLKEEALAWLRRMQSQGMEPDEATMGIVVQLHKRNGEFRKAQEFFRKWSKCQSQRIGSDNKKVVASCIDVGLSSKTCNNLIDTYGKAGQLMAASEILAKMIKGGIPLTRVTFNTMIRLYGSHGRLERVSLLLRKMVELGCPPDTRTYSILISVYIKHNDIRLAAKYFADMKAGCLEPDFVSYRMLVCAYSLRKMVREAEELVWEMDERGLEIDELTQTSVTRMYVDLGILKRAWLWFTRFDLAGGITSECYAATIDAYGQQGYILQAEKVFNCCKERKKLVVLVFNVMIKAYGIGRCYHKACEVFDCMERYGVVADKCSYSSIIHILVSADKPHTAKFYLKRMQREGLVSDCVPYCAVISGFSKLGQLEMAEGLYREMVQYDVQPDVIIYGVLINAFADAGSVKDAMSYVNEMRMAGFPGNPTIYHSLIKLYTKVGYLKEAQEAYKLLQASDQGPSLFSSNCMLDLYTERLMVEQAQEIFESMKEKEVANEFSYAMMLCMYKKIGRLDEATQIANQMRNLGLLTDLWSYNNILGLYAMDRRPWEATETFKEMIKSNIQPDDFTFRALGKCLLNCGVSKQAIGRLEVLVKKDALKGLQAWVLTLSCVLEGYDYTIERCG